jgi:DNA-binding response OmpR family regulator
MSERDREERGRTGRGPASRERPEPPKVRPVIVVADDDPDIQRLVVKALGTKYTVHVAGNGEEMARLLKTTGKPDAIILDVMMPGLDGFAIAKVLRQDPAFQSVPILFLTAKSDGADVLKGAVSGARYYVTKPFKVPELVEKVERMIEERPTVFVGSVRLDPETPEASVRRIAAQVLDPLSEAAGAVLEVTLEIKVKVPDGVPKTLVHEVAEQAKRLRFRTASFSIDDGAIFPEVSAPSGVRAAKR